MTPAPVRPPWAEPYAADFAALRQIIERSPNFVFQPVEVPSPDVVRVFVEWLRGQAWQVEVVDLAAGVEWAALPGLLRDLPSGHERFVVVVLGPPEIDGEAMHAAMAQLNMQRDSLARSLDRPLLWCGSAEFQQLTWKYAPDLWSVGAVPYQISLRRLEDALLRDPLSSGYWTGASAEAIQTLEARFAGALGQAKDRGDAAFHGLRLAEAQILSGRNDAAQHTLELVRPRLEEREALLPRFLNLLAATSRAHHDSATTEALQARIAEAEARGARRLEAQLRLELAGRMRTSPLPGARAARQAELKAARRIFHEAGDQQAVAGLDLWLSESLDESPDDDLASDIVRTAGSMVDSEVPLIRRLASVALAVTYIHMHRLEEADALLAGVLSDELLRGMPFLRGKALMVRASLAFRRADYELARSLYGEFVEATKEEDSIVGEVLARYGYAQSCLELGRITEACKELLAAADKVVATGYEADFIGWLYRVAQIALEGGAVAVGSALMVRAAIRDLGYASSHPDIGVRFDSMWLRRADQTEVADRIDAILAPVRSLSPDSPAFQERLAECSRELEAIATEIEAELRAEGIDLDDPGTWGLE